MKGIITRRECLALCCGMVSLAGCSSWNVLDARSQSPDDAAVARSRVRLVGDMAVPFGLYPAKVEAVGLVTGLPGTGGDPAPSPQRAALLAEMQTRGVDKPNAVLASPNTALVLIRGVLRPGIQKGDTFDVELRILRDSETTSLRGGYLLETRLRQRLVLPQEIHEGHVWGLAQGPVMVDPAADETHDRVLLGRGRILGGGVALMSRQLGLVLKRDCKSVVNSSRIALALNKRFHTFQKGVKVGVATAKTDEFVELTVHPRYKENVARYMRLLQAVPLHESATERMQRIAELKQRLLDPVTSAEAAMELEAIGSEGAEALCAGARAKDPEVRFYAAEALAYLDRREAAEPLGEAAREQPAFRVFALTALSAMDDYAAYEQLRDLLAVPSAETRYGAFRALWAMNPADALVKGEPLANQFTYHVLDVGGLPMIHATRSRRPEIVVFGQDQRFLVPLAVNAGNQVMVTSRGGDEITVSKFSVGEPDQKRMVSARVDEVIRAIVELGGTYPDVVQALQEAEAAHALPSRFVIDALPEAGRTYHRVAGGGEKDAESVGLGRQAGDSPLDRPQKRVDHYQPDQPHPGGKSKEETASDHPDPDQNRHSLARLFARMTGRDSD
jgi:flagellar basal body P-ring protein FlgI